MGYDVSRSITVRINGNRLAGVEKIETVYNRDRNIQDGKLSVSLKTIDVKITRKRHIEDTLNDGVELRPLKGFSLSVSYSRYDTSYENCEWVDYKEILGENDTVIEELTVAALSYKFAAT